MYCIAIKAMQACANAYSLSGLTGAADNRAQYTLDAMGNRTREEVKDARGNTTGWLREVTDSSSAQRGHPLATPVRSCNDSFA